MKLTSSVSRLVLGSLVTACALLGAAGSAQAGPQWRYVGDGTTRFNTMAEAIESQTAMNARQCHPNLGEAVYSGAPTKKPVYTESNCAGPVVLKSVSYVGSEYEYRFWMWQVVNR